MNTTGSSPSWTVERHPRNEDLSVDECWRLLQSEEVGRVGFVVDDRVQMFPVNFVAHENSVYFRTSADGAIGGVLHSQPASFEVDQLDEFLQVGWSVLVTGQGHRIDGPELLTEPWGPKPPEPWASGIRTLLIRVVAEQVTGRRVHPG